MALDCERILTEFGECLARVSIVNYYGNVVFDTLVRPSAKVFDYREWITGIKPMDLKHAPSHSKIAPIVRNNKVNLIKLRKILDGKIIVGHSLQEDFFALKLNDQETQCEVREISEFKIFKRPCFAYKRTPNFSGNIKSNYINEDEVIGYEKRKLKELAREYLNASI